MKLDRQLLVKVEPIKINKCLRCHRVFANFLDLEKHIADHAKTFYKHILSAHVALEKVEFYKCTECSERFHTQRDYVLHKVKHIQRNVKLARASNKNGLIPKAYKCTECNLSFVAKTTLEAHSVVHKPFPHICECGIGYYTEQDLDSHKELVHIIRSKDKTIRAGQLPWRPEITFQATHESKPNVISRLKGPKLKAHLILKSRTTKIKTVPKLKAELKEKTKRPREARVHPNIRIEVTKDNRYVCPECKTTFNSRSNVYVHYRIHNGDKPYVCTICTKAFSQPGTLKLHLIRHEGIKNFACEYCDKRFFHKNGLDRHLVIHSGVKPYVCSLCKKGFADPSALARHLRTHTGDKRYFCTYCPMGFTDYSGYRMHKKRHENKKDFSCDTCGKGFYDKNSMLKHTIVHEKHRVKEHRCEYCNQYYSSKYYLRRHIDLRHMKLRSHKCTYCRKSFAFNSELMRHMKIKHELRNKKFYCNDCGKDFDFKWLLSAHSSNVHSNNFFECNNCSKRFAQKYKLSAHILKEHVKIRCSDCSKYFSSHIALQNHKLEKMETCEICEKVFFCEGVKDKHLKVHIVKKKKQTYQCDLCGYLVFRRMRIISHFATAHEFYSAKYVCDYCKCCFTWKPQIISHIQQHHLENIKCKLCYKRFFIKSEYDKHKAAGCKAVKYSCTVCHKTFTKLQTLRNHKILHEPRVLRFKCDMCPKKYYWKSSLRTHVRAEHNDHESELYN